MDNDIEAPAIDPNKGPAWMQWMCRSVGEKSRGNAVAVAMEKAQYKPPKDFTTKPEAWRTFGFDIKTPEYGCVVCLEDFVGLFHHQVGSVIYLLGDVNGMIGVRSANESQIIACRWPDVEDFQARDYVPEQGFDT